MTDAVIVLLTCANREEALRIAAVILQERLAACVQILPSVQSFYWWHGAIEASEEILLLIKSKAAAFQKLKERIPDLHSYDTPEILAVPVIAGAEKYLAWVRESTEQLP